MCLQLSKAAKKEKAEIPRYDVANIKTLSSSMKQVSGAHSCKLCTDVDFSSEQSNLPLQGPNTNMASTSNDLDPRQESLGLALGDSSDLFIDFLLADRRSSRTCLRDHLPDQVSFTWKMVLRLNS